MRRKRVQNSKIFIKKPVSKRKVPWPRELRIFAPDIFDDLKEYPDYDNWKMEDRDTTTPFNVETTTCKECGGDLNDSPLVTRDGILYQADFAVDVKIGAKKCLSCGYWNHFDGYTSHIMNWNGIDLVDHSLMMRYFLSVKSQPRTSIFAFWLIQDSTYRQNNSKYSFPDRQKIFEMIKSFAYIFAMRFKWICLQCDRNLKNDINAVPAGEVDAAVADGVQVGFSKVDSNLVINPKCIFDDSYIVDNIVRESDRFIAKAPIRKLLRRFLYQHLPPIQQDRARYGKDKKNEDYLPRLSENELQSLQTHLRDIRLKSVIDMMSWIDSNAYLVLSNLAKQCCADFFRSLSCDEAVYNVCPSAINDILINGKNSILANRATILSKAPIVFAIIFDIQVDWPDWMFKLLNDLAIVSKHVIKTRKDKIGNDGFWEEREPTQQQQDIWDNVFRHGTRFSGKAKRQMPLFKTDINTLKAGQQKKKRKEKEAQEKKLKIQKQNPIANANPDRIIGPRLHNRRYDDSIMEEERTKCGKHFKEQNGKPAEMAVRCLHDGVYVGGHIMTKKEGPSDMFSFFTVFYKEPPKIFTVDFGCDYTPYAFNRSPGAHEDSKTVIDWFHSEDHVDCGPAQAIKYYKKYNHEWFALQDEACEQRNPILNKMRHLGCWTSMQTYVLLSSFLCEADNRTIMIKKLGHEGLSERVSNFGNVDPLNLRTWVNDYERFFHVPCAGNQNWDAFVTDQQWLQYSNMNDQDNFHYDFVDFDENSAEMKEDIINANENIVEMKQNRSEANENENKNENENENENKNESNNAVDIYDRLFNNPNLPIVEIDDDLAHYEPAREESEHDPDSIAGLLDQINELYSNS